MKPVPQARQTSMPGARLIKGALLNRIAEALQARTPLNAKSANAKGYTGAAKQGGVPAQGGTALPRYEAQRTYVISRDFVQRLAEALRARLPGDGVTRTAPIQATAAGIEALLRALDWVTPDAFQASAPAGYRQCACGGRVRGEHSECYTCWSRAGTCTAAGCSAPAPVGNRCSACCR